MIPSVANQRFITINKKYPNEDLKICFSKEGCLSAAEQLSHTGFKLWVYFNMKNNNETFPLYRADVEKTINIKETTYHKVFKELVEYGYLKQGKNKNHFIFSDIVESNIKNIHESTPIFDTLFCIYKYVDFNNNIVYIGKTKNLTRRCYQHNQEDKFKNFKGNIYYFSCASEQEMDMLEYVMINKYHPLLNVQFNSYHIQTDLNEPVWKHFKTID